MIPHHPDHPLTAPSSSTARARRKYFTLSVRFDATVHDACDPDATNPDVHDCTSDAAVPAVEEWTWNSTRTRLASGSLPVAVNVGVRSTVKLSAAVDPGGA